MIGKANRHVDDEGGCFLSGAVQNRAKGVRYRNARCAINRSP
jgi:hypothetical protein